MSVLLAELRLLHYRNISDLRLSPAPGFNILAGANAQGKTNVLESICLLSTGKVLRGARSAQAIQEGESETVVWGRTAPYDDEIEVRIGEHSRKRASVNGSTLARSSDLLGRLPTVVFSSQDLAIITGEPSDRRQFLDLELSQLFPAYLKHLTAYKRALEHRNALLRRSQEVVVDRASLEVWEAPLVQHGAEIRAIRSAWLVGLSELARQGHARLGSGETLLMRPEVKEPGDLGELYATKRHLEIARGSTLFGPHRDDLSIEVGGRPAREFGSQGQQRTAVIAIKLAVLEEAKSVFGFPPILLLDDIFSDLDQHRRSALVEAASEEGGQVFLTCTEAELAGRELVGQSKVFRVRSGEACEA